MCVGAQFTFDDHAIFTAEPLTRPLTWVTYWLNRFVSGDFPAAFHVVNLVLHLIAVWLCRDALRRILPPRTADIGASVFALHPLQAGEAARTMYGLEPRC